VEQRFSTPPQAENPVTAQPSDGEATSQVADNTDHVIPTQSLELQQDFTLWLKEHISQLRQYAYFLCKDKAFSKDLVQDVALKLYRIWDNDERRGLVKSRPGYAFEAVKNSFLDYSKVPSRTNQRETILEGEQGEGNISPPIDLETIWSIRDAIRLLDDEHRVLIYLVYYQYDGNVSAAGRVLGMTSSQVNRLHKKALEVLRSRLKNIRD
jgi:RNA polymerase sigma factor (sigma-70 family)